MNCHYSLMLFLTFWSKFINFNNKISIMPQVSIVEEHQVPIVNVERSRRDFVNAEGIWETRIAYGDRSTGILMGYLSMTKGDPNVPTDYTFIKEIHVKEDTFGIDMFKKQLKHQTYTSLLFESAELIAKDEHGSSKIAAGYEPWSSAEFKRLFYEREDDLMVKDLHDSKNVCFLDNLNCKDLMFDKNKNLIQNPIDADALEREWLQIIDEEYKQHNAL